MKELLFSFLAIDFDEIMKNPDNINSLNEIDAKNPTPIRKALKKVKEAKAEVKKTVTATSK